MSSSASSSINVGTKAKKSSRGVASSPAIFPNVITGPGSPPGNQPPVLNTIENAFENQRIEQTFGQQRSSKTKLADKVKNHANTRQRIEEFLAAPTSHHDPTRPLSRVQLALLSEDEFVRQAIQVLTVANPKGVLRLADNSSINMSQCILEFAQNSKVRDGPRYKKLLKERMLELKEISRVDRSLGFPDEEDIDVFSNDAFSDDTDKNTDLENEVTSSVKRKLQATLAGVTVGKQQKRLSGKRQHKPTERFGINVGIKDPLVLYASHSRTLQENRRLLTEPYRPRAPRQSTEQNSADSDPPQDTSSSILFPVTVEVGSAASSVNVVQQTAAHDSSCSPAAVVPPVTIVVDNIYQQHAAVAVSMSAAPFAVCSVPIGEDGDGDDSSSTHTTTSDYGVEDHNSNSSLGNTDYNGSISPDEDDDAYLQDRQGHHSDLFEMLFKELPVHAEYRLPNQTINNLHGPLVFPSHSSSLIGPILQPHVDDHLVLSQASREASFEDIAHLLYINWNILHLVKTVADIKQWLEGLSNEDHLLLVHLHAAYWVTIPITTLSFGATKQNFWTAVNSASAFVNDVFVVTRQIPLVSVTVESFIVRTVGQWIQFLSFHKLTVADIWNVPVDNVLDFAALDATVHPRYDVLLPALIEMVNYCNDTFRQDWSIENCLHRQFAIGNTNRLQFTHIDANVLIMQYFPGCYDVPNLGSSDGLHLLQRMQTFLLTMPTPLQYMSECSERWIHLLACMALPITINVTVLSTEDKIKSLVVQFPPSFSDNHLRTNYPLLLHQHSSILKEFLDSNPMAQSLYGQTVSSDTYGVLRLKIMGCVVAIVQDAADVENVDAELSRSDIFYISHVGGILRTPHRQFCSNLFIIFDSNDVVNELNRLFNSKLPVLIAPAPRQPHRLSSAGMWERNFENKLPTVEQTNLVANAQILALNASIVLFSPFEQLRPQFRPSRHDLAMVQKAVRSDHVRKLALEVKASYDRVSGRLINSSNAEFSSSRFNFSPPAQQGARFGAINVDYDEWSEYIDPIIYSVQDQQLIRNWNNVTNLTFRGDGLAYLQCIKLFHTAQRPIVVGDKMVFLHSPNLNVIFTPEQPHRTLFSMTHVLYTVVHIKDSIFYFDRVELLYNYVAMDLLSLKIKCPYVGTYILFESPSTSGQSLPTVPSSSPSHQQHSTSKRNSSNQSRVRPGSLQQQTQFSASSSSCPPTDRARTSASTTTGSNLDALQSRSAVNPAGYDSDDSQVKKKTKVASLEWQGKVFYVTGKESALNILRDTFSVRTLMEDGQLQNLVNHVGDFVNNYTADAFKMGIIKCQSKSAFMAGMTLTINTNHDLDRFQSLACYAIKEIQDNLYFQHYSFPDAQTTFSLCAEHYLQKADADACGFAITSYDFWVRSWKGYHLVVKLLLGPSYGTVIKEIIDEIQQDNIGQYNDVGYLLSLTATMRALLYEYSSSIEDFTLGEDTTVYTPATMHKSQWLDVIKYLWKSFKEKLSYSRQAEYTYARSQYSVDRHRPYSGKVVKVNSGQPKTKASTTARTTVTVTPNALKSKVHKGKTKYPTTSTTPSPSAKQGRKVAFGVSICVNDLAKKYQIKTSETCKPDCPYTHYDDLPANLTATSVLDRVKKVMSKFNISEGQSQQFLRKIEADTKFK